MSANICFTNIQILVFLYFFQLAREGQEMCSWGGRSVVDNIMTAPQNADSAIIPLHCAASEGKKARGGE